jgi:hypothetical protein
MNCFRAACLLVLSLVASAARADGTAPVAPAAPAVAAEGAAAAPATPAPKLTVDPPSFDSGPVARDSVVEKVFTLANEGDAPLRIDRIVATGNTALSSRPSEIPAKGKVQITVRIELLPERALGLIKQLEIHSNDPQRPKIVVPIRIESTEFVQPRPDRARWNSVQQEMDGTITSYVKAVDGKPFRVLGVSPAPPGIRVVTVPVSAAEAAARQPAADGATATLDPNGAHETWKVAMTLAKDAPVGAIVGQLELTIDHEKQKIVPIPLSGFMRPVVAVTPHELVMGEIPVGSARSHSFFVRNFATEPIELTKVDSDIPGFSEGVITVKEAGRSYDVKVAMDLAKNAPGPLQGVIRFHFASPKTPVYTLPVSAVIK